MNRVDELIAELCPDGVEYQPLEDVFDIKNGYTPSRKKPEYWENGDVNWFRMEDIRANGRILKDSIQKVTSSGIKGGKLFEGGSLIVATSATIGEHALVTVPFMCNQRFTCLTRKSNYVQKLDMRYMLHYADVLDSFCLENTNKGGFASVSMPAFRKFEIPVPPIEVQREIVRILDTFTVLTDELTDKLAEEVAVRNQQYTYYRDRMLSRENLETMDGKPVEMVKLGNVARIFDGTHQTPKYVSSGIKFVSVENIDNLTASNKFITKEAFVKEYKNPPECGDVLMTRIGSIGSCAVVETDEPLAYYVSLSLIKPNRELIIPKFLRHAIEGKDGRRSLNRRTIHTAVPIKINLGDVSKVEIPVPSLATQQKVVDILDRFDALTTSLTDGLPAEIEARRQQYEYYRDRLLDFSRKEDAAR